MARPKEYDIVEFYIRHPECLNWSVTQIADHLGVSYSSVRSTRAAAIADGRLTHIDTIVVNRKGYEWINQINQINGQKQ